MPRKRNTETVYYVYVLFDFRGLPRYVGYGRGSRWIHHEQAARRVKNHLKAAFVRKTLAILQEIPKIKIAEGLTRSEACKVEIALISAIGRVDLRTGPLTNLSAGGDGGDFGSSIRLAKSKWTPEERVRHSKTYSQATKRYMSALTIKERKDLFKAAAARQVELRQSDPTYDVERGKLISKGHAKRTPEQKRSAVLKALVTNPPANRSKRTSAWHASMTAEQRRSRSDSISKTLTGREFPGDRIKLSNSVKQLWQDPGYRAKQAQRTPSGANTKWITDGTSNKRLKLDKPVPDGWWYGKT